MRAILSGVVLQRIIRSTRPRPQAHDPDADLPDVTEEELQEYVAAHGFPPGYLSDEVGPLHDGLKIDVVSPGYYETYHRERGRKSDVRTFATLAAAHADVIQRLLTATRLWQTRTRSAAAQGQRKNEGKQT